MGDWAEDYLDFVHPGWREAQGQACTHPFWQTLSCTPGRSANGQRGILVREQCTTCGKVIEHVRPEVSL